jgi:glutamate-1-semialdehyde 2,1-aminomutase
VALRQKSELARRAEKLIPGGVNSPVRAMRSVGLDEPIFVRSGSGSTIEDVDGNRYLDWVLSWGPLLFGHADDETLAAIAEAAQRGTTFGAPTEGESSWLPRSSTPFPPWRWCAWSPRGPRRR